jgi:hypothetical protein
MWAMRPERVWTSLKRIPVHQKSVLGVIHFFDGLAQADEISGDAGQLGFKGFGGRGSGHNMNLRSGKNGREVWLRPARTGNGDAGEARRFGCVVFAGQGSIGQGFASRRSWEESLKSPRVSQPFWRHQKGAAWSRR